MSKVEQYIFNCAVSIKDQLEMLHLEVKSKTSPDQTYSKHYQYLHLPTPIKLVFRNLAHIFVFLQRRELVYFDEQENSLKICLTIAGEIKQFSLPLDDFCKQNVWKQKIEYLKMQKARIEENYNKILTQKRERLEQEKRKYEEAREEREDRQKCLNDLNKNSLEIEGVVFQLKKDCEEKMSRIRELAPKGEETQKCVFTSVKSLKKYEQKKKHWISEVGKLKNEKLQRLKVYINQETDFEAQTSLSISFLALKKMLFVEIFVNLQVLDLSNNFIVAIEGLNGLRQLLKLNLAHNRISWIPMVGSLGKLVQLVLKSNCIRKMENIFHLRSLQVVNLSLNRIESVPDEIASLTRLVEIRLYGNCIANISDKILLLRNLKICSVTKNKCYGEGSRSREVINRLMRNGVKTALEQVDEITLLQ